MHFKGSEKACDIRIEPKTDPIFPIIFNIVIDFEIFVFVRKFYFQKIIVFFFCKKCYYIRD